MSVQTVDPTPAPTQSTSGSGTVTLNPVADTYIKAGGLISMARSSRTGDLLVFNAREAGSSLAPQLIVSYQ